MMRTHLRESLAVVVTASVLSSLSIVARQQTARDAVAQPSIGTAQIAGRATVDEPNGPPLRRVTVLLQPIGLPFSAFQAVTDDAGRFTFKRLPGGVYTARASKPGFVPLTYGEKRPNGLGTPITVTDGQSMTLDLKLFRGAVITGTILDGRGLPLPQVSVRPSMIRVNNGVRTPVSTPFSGTSTTDDRGMYRIFGLAPGTYIVAASPRLLVSGEVRAITAEELQWAQRQMPSTGGATSSAAAAPPRPAQAVAYTPIYFPGTTDLAGAEVVTLAPGEERNGVNFGVQYVPTAKVEGNVTGPDGQPALNAQINMVSHSETSVDPIMMLDTMLMMRPVTTNGRFTIPGVRPGEYTIAVRAAPANAGGTPAAAGPPGRAGGAGPAPMTLWGSADVTVNGVDVSGIEVRLQPGMTVSGRVVFEGTTLQPPADLSRVTIRLSAAPTAGVTVTVGASPAQVAADGTFKIEGVTPARYFVSATAAPAVSVPGSSWIVRTATFNGINAADVPFDVLPGQDLSDAVITFTDKAAEVTGTLFDGAGRPTPEFSVMLFPADKAMWSQRSRRIRPPVRVGNDGKFKFGSLLPGEYYIAALTDYEPSEVYTAAFLEQVAAAGAMKITVAEGEKKVQDLKISGLGVH